VFGANADTELHRDTDKPFSVGRVYRDFRPIGQEQHLLSYFNEVGHIKEVLLIRRGRKNLLVHLQGWMLTPKLIG
jgi:hypothetical protein